MRHLISLIAKAAHPGGMRSTPAPAMLVAAASFPLTRPTGSLRAVATAVDLATIATAAHDDLRPATGAHVQAARGRLHWRFLQNAKEEESNKVDGPREQCDTDGSRGCLGRLAGRHVDTLVEARRRTRLGGWGRRCACCSSSANAFLPCGGPPPMTGTSAVALRAPFDVPVINISLTAH